MIIRDGTPKDHVFYEYVLTEHADWFAKKIRVGVQAHGLPSPEVTAEEIDRFEDSFCLRLQILRTPEQAQSADMDTLLEGGAGVGIFTPEDIVAEKAVPGGQPGEEASTTASATPSQASLERFEPDAPHSTTDAPPATEWTQLPPADSAPRNKPGPTSERRLTGKPKGKGRFT